MTKVPTCKIPFSMVYKNMADKVMQVSKMQRNRFLFVCDTTDYVYDDNRHINLY